MTVFEPKNKPKNNNTKRSYEVWRKEVGEHRPYIDANKLVNVRRDIMNKERLAEAETEDIKKTVRKQTKTEKPKPEDVAVKMENLTPGKIENPVKQIRQGKEVNQQNQNPEMEQPQENARGMPEEMEQPQENARDMPEEMEQPQENARNMPEEMEQPQENARDMPEEREELDAETKETKEEILRQIIQIKT